MEVIINMNRNYMIIGFVLLLGMSSATVVRAQNDMTPKETEMMTDLQARQVVFLCFYAPDDQMLETVKGEIQPVVDNFKGAVQVVYVSSSDIAENELREKFNVISDEANLFIVVPPGFAVAQLQGEDITKTNLMKALLSSCGGGGCGSSSSCG